jgi:hypothetical protein
MMDPNIKTLWVNALRSGQYKQISGRLCKVVNGDACYCALGVLCDIHRVYHRNNGSEIAFDWDANHYDRKWTYLGADTALPETVREWAGLSSHDPVVVFDDGEASSIADMNDQLKLSFNDIADLIEADKTL